MCVGEVVFPFFQLYPDSSGLFSVSHEGTLRYQRKVQGMKVQE